MARVEILGIIPARGGSKRLPGKNIAPLHGKPLLTYTCEAASGSRHITRVVLSTDDDAIANVGRDCGIEVIPRPKELATDDATSVDVALHVLSELKKGEGYTPNIVVLLQPTSPLRTAADIDRGVDFLMNEGVDSVISVTGDGKRNGALYVIRTEVLESTKDFAGGKHQALVMDEKHSVDIDTAADLAHAESVLISRKNP